VGEQLDLKVYPARLLFAHHGKLIAEHERSYEKHKDTVDTEHDKALLEKRKLQKSRRLLNNFFALGEIAEKYEKGLNCKRNNPRRHIRQIMGLIETFGSTEVKKAMEDTCELEVFSADAVLNILEIRRRPCLEPSPLRLTRKTDCLDIELPEVDLEVYNIK